MTVTNTPSLTDPITVADGVTEYDFEFKVYQDEDVKVQYTDTDGVLTILDYGDDYTVELGEDNIGGTVTVSATLEATGEVVVYRSTTREQSTSLPNLGPFFAATIEAELDRVTMLAQESSDNEYAVLAVNAATAAAAALAIIDGDKEATAADRVQTGLDATATAADRVQTGLDATATAADRVQTGLDATATAAARVQTGLDVTATAADAVQTGLDATATAADAVQTGLDATTTAADAVQTGLDATATAADRVQTGLDATATAADAVQTGLDATATAADAVQTGLDVASAAGSEAKSEAWATADEDVEVEPGEYSSLHWAAKAAASAALNASATPFTPSGDLSATNVQDAINELDDEKVSKSGDTMTGDLVLDALDGIGSRSVIFSKANVSTGPLDGERMAGLYARSIDPNNSSSIRTRAFVKVAATEDHDHAANKAGTVTQLSHNTKGTTTEFTNVEIDDDGVKAKVVGSSYGQVILTPTAWGCSPDYADTLNDTRFAALLVAAEGREVDLEGLTWPVTSVPKMRARNGYWKVTDYDGGADVMLPAKGTLDAYTCQIDGGARNISWAQDMMSSYNGLSTMGYKAANAHGVYTLDTSIAWSADGWKSATRIEEGGDFAGYTTSDIAVWSMGIVPPSNDAVGSYQIAIVVHGSLLHYNYRELAQYDTDSAGGGGITNEGAWTEGQIGGVSLGQAIRTAVYDEYSLSVTGLPTLCHSFSVYGSANAVDANFLFGFHGLDGTTGPFLGYVSSAPKDGSASLGFVANIGLLTEGVEPTVAWCKNGGSSRLAGFIRSQGSSYPIRFWTSEGVSNATVEAAAIQDCPWGDDFANLSPIPLRTRPRRQGATSGWIATWETVDGNTDDELHFCFTGTRTRDGSPGKVGLYWGSVTRGSGTYETMWSRCKVVKLADLYFANANITETSNQVGVCSLTFSDANTLHIAASTEIPAIGQDYDGSSKTVVYTIKLHDDYADAAEQVYHDDGSTWPRFTVKAPEWVDY